MCIMLVAYLTELTLAVGFKDFGVMGGICPPQERHGNAHVAFVGLYLSFPFTLAEGTLAKAPENTHRNHHANGRGKNSRHNHHRRKSACYQQR